MADNTTLPGSGEVVRDVDRGTAKTQVVLLDFGGENGPETMVTPSSPLPVSDSGGNGRILNLLLYQNLLCEQATLTNGFIPMETPGFLVGG